MTLPTAVRRNAERAKQQVAAQNAQHANGALQQPAGEFLDLSNLNQSAVPAANVAPVPATTLVAQQNQQQAPVQTAPAVNDTHRPHALAEGYDDTAQSHVDNGTENASNAAPLAHANTAIANGQDISQQQAQPDFINPEDWKARYAALRASRDARVNTLEQQVAESTSTIQTLNQKLDTLQGEADDAARRFTLDDETRERLGPDQAKAFDQFSESVEQRFAKQDEQDQDRERQRMTQFESNLESMVPNWRTINATREWLDWLGQIDEVMGTSRQAMLDQFVAGSDATSAAALFRSFALRNSPEQQRNGHVPSPEVSGTRADSGLSADDSMVEVWSQSEIAQFYQAKNRLYQAGKLVGAKLEQVMAEEARIRKAMDEGRVDMNS